MKGQVKFGLPPGTVIYTGERQDLETKIELLTYSAQEFLLELYPDEQDLLEERKMNRWIMIRGLKDVATLLDLAKAYHMPQLILEDIVNVNQRAHLTEKDQNLCVILRYYNLEYKRKQVSLWMTHDAVISFQETHDILFQPILDRLNQEYSETRKLGVDRLFVVLLDYIVDLYYTVLDKLEEDITNLEDRILISTKPANHMKEIHALKTVVHRVHQDMKSIREITDALHDDFQDALTEASQEFAQDVHTHVAQILDTLENYRNTLSSLIDLGIALQGNRMNEIMKFLTVLSTFFLPLSFITGWYGMNWTIPEIKAWPDQGYYVTLGAAVAIIVALYVYFRKKDWL